MPAPERTEARSLTVLERIGAYRLHRHVEATVATQIYLAREDRPEGDGPEVMLKIVQSASPEDAEHTLQLRRQAPTLCNLQHPFIVRTLEFFDHLDSLVLVLESIDGVSLAELLEMQRGAGKVILSDAAALHIAVSVLDALAYAHGVSDASGAAAPVVHKAVSPANVLVARDGTVKLGGFGFVKPFGISTDGKGRFQWEAPCMAPEQIEGGSPTPKVDVYAVGLILWELLAGRPARALPRNPLSALALGVMTRRPTSLAIVRPDLAPDLTAVVDAALASLPEERTLTCAEMAQRIRKFAPGGSGQEDLQAVVRSVPSVSLGEPRLATKLAPRPSPPRAETGASAARLKASAPREGAAQPIAPEPAVLVMPIVDLSAAADVPDESAQRPNEASPASAAGPSDDIDVTGAEEILFEDHPVDDDRIDEPALPVHNSGIQRISLIDRMKRPTRWRRRTLLGIWAGLFVLLVPLIVLLRNRAPLKSVRLGAGSSSFQTVIVHNAAGPEQAAAPALPATSEVRPGESEPPASAAAVPEASPPASEPNEVADPPLRPGFARLIVHSSTPSAMVYGRRAVYGSVEEPLVVPCGRQFFRTGVPGPGGKRIAWQGRGKMIPIACGQAVEITMGAGARAPR